MNMQLARAQMKQLASALTPKDEPPRVFICSTRHYGGHSAEYTVLCEGDYWLCDSRQLALLRSGMSPDDLELERTEDS